MESPQQAPPAYGEALARCVGDSERFLAECWGRRAHLHRGADDGGLLDVEDVDYLLSSTALRAPAFRLVKGGVTLDPATCTRRARIGSRTITDLIDVARVYDHFADGATIVLQGLHRYWPPVTELCRKLEDELTHPVQANAYVTPPVSQGLRIHADAHDVFAMQTHGRKQWVVYAGEQAADGADPAPSLDTELAPGYCLYLPKGVRHAARTVDRFSIHLTVGVRALTWADVLGRALDGARAEASLDDALPAGFARAPQLLRDEAAQRLAAFAAHLRRSDVDAALDGAAQRFWMSRQHQLHGQLQQLIGVGAVDDATLVRRRPHVVCELRREGDALLVALSDRTLRMPSHAEPALRELLERGELRPRDLERHLDEAGRITLIRRLVREGLLAAVDG